MARTKQEVRDFLNSQVGLSVNDKCGIYKGQCVSLIKALLEFLGAPDPYAARGNARDCGDTIVRQGIAANAPGWLNVCVNRDMGLIDGVRYGHIWIDITNEMNFEQNGSRALRTTKNTRPFSQSQQVVNLDKYIEEDNMDNKVDRGGLETIWKGFLDRAPMDAEYKAYVGMGWASVIFTAYSSPEYKARYAGLVKNYNTVTYDVPKLNARIKELETGKGNCTPEERAYLDAMYKVIDKEG